MSNDQKSSANARCPGCGGGRFVLNLGQSADTVAYVHKPGCQVAQSGKPPIDVAAEPVEASAPAQQRVRLHKRDEERLAALRGIGTAVKGLVGTALDGQHAMRAAAQAMPPSARIDAVIDAGTTSAREIAAAAAAVSAAVRAWPTRALSRSTERFVVRRRLTPPGLDELVSIEAEAKDENGGHEAFGEVSKLERERIAERVAEVGAPAVRREIGKAVVLELCERRPGGYATKRTLRLEVPK